MKKYLPYAALAAVGAVVAFVALVLLLPGNSTPGPDSTASAWAQAMASHDYQAACDLEVPAYRGPDCANNYRQNIEMASAIAGKDLTQGLHLVGSCQPEGDRALCAVTGPNLGSTAQMTVKQGKDGRWMVTSVE